MYLCPQCHSNRVVTGRLVEYGSRNPAVFRPDSLRFLALTAAGGAALNKESLPCRDCGLVWNFADKDKLNRFLQKQCAGRDGLPTA